MDQIPLTLPLEKVSEVNNQRNWDTLRRAYEQLAKIIDYQLGGITNQTLTKEVTVYRESLQISASEEFLNIKIPRLPDGTGQNWQVSANFLGSTGITINAAAASTVFTLFQDTGGGPVAVGTITWGIAATTAVFATTGGLPIVFASDNIMTLKGAATPDTTLSKWGIVITMLKA